jgi:hypothetical protein
MRREMDAAEQVAPKGASQGAPQLRASESRPLPEYFLPGYFFPDCFAESASSYRLDLELILVYLLYTPPKV